MHGSSRHGSIRASVHVARQRLFPPAELRCQSCFPCSCCTAIAAPLLLGHCFRDSATGTLPWAGSPSCRRSRATSSPAGLGGYAGGVHLLPIGPPSVAEGEHPFQPAGYFVVSVGVYNLLFKGAFIEFAGENHLQGDDYIFGFEGAHHFQLAASLVVPRGCSVALGTRFCSPCDSRPLRFAPWFTLHPLLPGRVAAPSDSSRP